ncbi:structural maintenance of chromosomes protein 2-like [Gigantopelta aegis]|uniref:structural maintenance of chromosomes protein 2-like n=1 Tax=Gigantopelta aegis TaxID=1735272 RepID=UPI001B88C285|nr:structural maintenance of chromosomes protein 2-like [Gigantopelta aegis]
MYIKCITIDGFKSYAQRTEINDFDPLFNAITGLNGSGKSNILDAICFLLGITNLTHVRASNLQDLVYKSGQAGVTKATVSITFDNLDKKQSPLGYEQYDEFTVTRQVVIGGRNKYLINGSNANNTRVQDLFRSVQLNVNNPHFLIMQGRITKVLNMKPPEILSMIEEAAGTRLYETKKEAAQKTIEKKDAKLREIDTVLKEDITPTLAKLKEERSSFLEYQKIIRELEHLNKLYVAYQFVCAEEKKKKSAEELVEMENNVKALKEKIVENENKVKKLGTVIADLEQRRDEESGSVMTKLESELAEKKTLDAKAQSAVDSKKESMKTEQKKHKELTKNCEDNKKMVCNREKDMEKLNKQLETLREQSEQDQEASRAAQKHFHAVSAGLSSNADGEDATLSDQLITAKHEISHAETEIKQAQMRLKNAQQEIKKKQADLKKTESDYKKDQSVYDAVQKSMNKIEAELKKLGFEEGKDERLAAERRSLSQSVHNLQEKLETLEARFPQLNFQYKDPEKNFDRSKVHGLVCKLIKVNDVKTATALEIAAGSKLYNVVVDTEVTGKKLLQKGELRRRYTIIPLNKIAARSIDATTVKRAESLVGANNVSTALSLIGYEKDLKTAMEFVFGSSFVCADMNAAKKVTYDDKVMKKSVTLDGESFDPAGTLSGGARAQSGSILEKLQELKDVEDELHTKTQNLREVEQELENIKKTSEKFTQLKQQYELKSHEAELVKARLEQGSHHQQLEEINALQKLIEEQTDISKKAEETQRTSAKKVKDLEDKIKNAKSVREKELKEAENALNEIKKKLEDSSKKTKEKLQEVESIKLEIEELKKEIVGYEDQLKTVSQSIDNYEKQQQDLEENTKETKPPRHGHAQAPHHTSWDGCPVMLQCLLQLSEVLWWIRLVLNTTSQLVPHVLYWVHVRGNCWPVQHSDMVGTKKRLCTPGSVRPIVVLLEDEPVFAMPSHQWEEDRPQDVVDVVLRIKVSLYHHEFGPEEDKATVGSVAMQSCCGKTSPDSSGADESSPGSHFSPGSACGCQKPIAQVEALLQQHDWIADEKKYFGQPNTAYDFQTNSPKEAERRIHKLQETKEKLSKNVNMRAMNMLGKAEEQYTDLMKKRKIVLQDKAKIASVIQELDEKKNEALKKAWEQVNKDFGSIFSTLLPGTHAKLSPPEGQTVLDGLEVKVAFGDVWKESLSELSGGQRSLVALSLILAMLLFKPAPIYILDEVDAALDLSHTQNIGQMIKSHFKHSQFIVVSLKDGMFSNANVLYKTKFVDGVSTVTRHVQQSSSRSLSTNADKENERTARKKNAHKRPRMADVSIN